MDEGTLRFDEEFSCQGDFRVRNDSNVTVYATTHDSSLADKLNAMEEGCAAVVDYTYSSVASADAFRAIAGKNKRIIFVKDAFQWVFDGLLIAPEKCKNIDLNVIMKVVPATNLGFWNEQDVLRLDFAPNGELPGRVDFRVYTEYILAKYGTGTKEFFVTLFQYGQPAAPSAVASIAKDQYTTFQMTHNSTYILSATKPVALSKLSILPVKATIGIGNSVALTVDTVPANAAKPELTWKSSNSKIATVNSKGVVKGLRQGKVTITATTRDGSGKSAKCTVAVSDSVQPVSEVRLSKTSFKINVKKTVALRSAVAPGDATNQTLVWTSSNPNVATVNQKGKITAVGKGKAYITAAATDGSGQKAVCKVTVVQPVKKITMPKTSSVKLGKKIQLKPTVAPSNASSKKLTWKSSNPKIAWVDSRGIVKGLKKGKVDIYAVARDGSNVKAKCRVTVR